MCDRPISAFIDLAFMDLLDFVFIWPVLEINTWLQHLLVEFGSCMSGSGSAITVPFTLT